MDARWRRGLHAVGLLAAVAFVVSVTYVPHLDTQAEPGVDEANPWRALGSAYEDLLEGEQDTYPYPIHVDEHAHWAFAAEIQRTGTLDHGDVYRDGPADDEGFSLVGNVHERGFQLAMAQFQDLTGIAWLTIFEFGPSLWAGLVAVLVWAGLRPWPGAEVAAGLTALMPTTVRFLGPGFLVPITFGLAWVAVVLVLLPRLGRSVRGPALGLLTVFWAFFVHVIAGFVALALLLAAIPFVAREAREEGVRKRLAGMGIAAALPMLWLYEAFFDELLRRATGFGRPLDPTVFDQIGLAFLATWAVGLGLVGYRAPENRGTQFRAATALTVVLMATILSNFFVGPRRALYDRFHQPFLLLACIPAAYAILGAGRLVARAGRRLLDRLAGLDPGRWSSLATPVVAVAAFVAVATPGVQAHLTEPYYHVLDDGDLDRFRWIEANVGDDHEVFLVHPWKAPILTAMTGKEPYTVLRPGSPPDNGREYVDYLTGTSNDTRWLLERDISLVVGPRAPDSPVFEEGPGTVSWLQDRWAQRLAKARAR